MGVEPLNEEIVDFWYGLVLLHPEERFSLSAFDQNNGEVLYTRVADDAPDRSRNDAETREGGVW